MGDEEDATTPAGRYLLRRMNDLGYKAKADLADTAGVSRSTITRLFKRPEYRPDVDVMRRLARGLQVEHDELVAAIYGEDATPERTDLHPLAAELGRMLAADSPLPEGSREVLDAIVDRVIDPSRREMRGGRPVPSLHVGDAARGEAWSQRHPNAVPYVELDLPVDGPLPPEVDHFLRMLQSFDPGLRAQALRMLQQITWTLTVATTGSAIPVEEVLRTAEDGPSARMRGHVPPVGR